jgi:hypothetical protein
MPMEASSLIGSLGGIGAIARDVFGGGSLPNGADTAGDETPPASPRATRTRNATHSVPAAGVKIPNPFAPKKEN